MAAAAALVYWTMPRFARAVPTVSAPRVPVVVGTPVLRDLPIRLLGIGTVQSLNVVNVKVRVDGALQRVAFVEGQEVHPGDLLAQIDPRPFQAQLKQAEATLQKDQAQLASAQVELARYTSLAALGAAPSQNVDTQKAQASVLTATVLADQAAVDTARLQLEFATIRSPIEGRVGLRQVDPGSIVHATDANGLVTITQMHPVAVLFSLPQDELPEIVARQSHGKLKVAAYARDGGRHLADGELQFVDNQVDTATGQIRLRATYPNTDQTLWPGELVATRVLLYTAANAVVVPSRAVLTGSNDRYVYVLKADDTVEPRTVQVGPTVDGFTAIANGIATSDTIVFDGQVRLSAGAKVDATRGTTEAAGSGKAGS